MTPQDPELQKGFDPADEAVHVAHCAKKLPREVGIIALSCGVREPRGLRRAHARLVQDNGQSVALNELYPDVERVYRG